MPFRLFAKVLKKYLKTLKWGALLRPPYSGIASSHHWLSHRMQHDIEGNRFTFFCRYRKLAPNLDRVKKGSYTFDIAFEILSGKK